jgi:hypothetical protein
LLAEFFCIGDIEKLCHLHNRCLQVLAGLSQGHQDSIPR